MLSLYLALPGEEKPNLPFGYLEISDCVHLLPQVRILGLPLVPFPDADVYTVSRLIQRRSDATSFYRISHILVPLKRAQYRKFLSYHAHCFTSDAVIILRKLKEIFLDQLSVESILFVEYAIPLVQFAGKNCNQQT